MNYESVIKEARDRMKKAVEVLKGQYHGMRTGRANPGLVEEIRADYYGSLTPIKQIANVSAPEPNLLMVKPFDPSSIKEIDKAIQKADLGIQPSNDGKAIRLIIPPLSEDRRKQLVSHAKQQAEETRIAVRNIRRDSNKKGEQLEKESIISKDDLEDFKKDIQKLTNKMISKIDDIFKKKSAELLEF